LDLTIQKDLEKMVADTASDLAALGLTQAAVVVLSLPKREVLAWVGSTDFFDPQEGQNDGVLALRQPGSALKPFIYQLALEEGLITAGTILEDGPIDFSSSQGSFTPRNYGETYHGPVPARVALASSLNIPAIKLIKALGPKKVLKRLNALGLNFKDDSDFYGLGLALGNGEVSLLALTNAYASMALNGASGEPQTLAADPKPAGDRPKTLSLMDPGAAFIVSHILADDGARALGFGRGGVLATPYPAAVKTGTSQNFRDNWCVGYTERFVIGVWAGNFQGQPMGKVSGVTGAGQLWRKIADYLVTRYPPGPLKPIAGVVANEICPISGLLKGPKCPNGVREYFLSKLPFPKVCDHDLMGQNLAPELSLTLISPKSQETYAVDPSLAPDYQLLATKVVVGPAINEVRWLINGSLIARKTPQNGRAQAFLPLERGYIKLTVLGLKNQDIVAETSANYLVK
jgi:penicillin-binding protein 1C